MDENRAKRPLRKAELMAAIVRGVAAAHRAGIHHADLKPANILLTTPPDVQPKITDFGLAGTGGDGKAESAEAVQVGTPLYWPPEAYQTFAQHNPAQFDVFALGVIWYQLITESLCRPQYDYQTELRDKGADSYTIQLIGQCLAHPERRFADAGQLADLMEKGGGLLPDWSDVPDGLFDVSHLVREYVAIAGK
jgi:serine/threonine protein kinase